MPNLSRLCRSTLLSAGLCAIGANAQTTTLYSNHPETGGGFGTVVASVPDTNGDGKADIIVGAFNQSVGNILGAGRVTIHSGANGAVLRTLVSPNKEILGWFGGAVAGIPDVTGDGRGDILVGAYNEINNGTASSGRGRVYIFNGSTGALVRTITSPNPETGGAFGRSVAGMSDVTGDGRGDIAIGAYREDPFAAPIDAGRAYIFNGTTGALLKTLVSVNQTPNGQFGVSISAMADATGDGKADVLVGASGESPGGITAAGRVYIYNGVTGAAFRGYSSWNPSAGGRFGSSVGGVPDANGDGRGDLIVGAPFENNGQMESTGRAYLFSGTASLLRVFSAGVKEAGDLFGSAVAGVPDVNGDGRGDVVIGAAHADPGGSPADSGRAYIYSGSSGVFIRALASSAPEAGAAFGTSVAGMPDTNGNGQGEVVVGVPFENTNTINDVGRAYFFRN